MTWGRAEDDGVVLGEAFLLSDGVGDGDVDGVEDADVIENVGEAEHVAPGEHAGDADDINELDAVVAATCVCDTVGDCERGGAGEFELEGINEGDGVTATFVGDGVCEFVGETDGDSEGDATGDRDTVGVPDGVVVCVGVGLADGAHWSTFTRSSSDVLSWPSAGAGAPESRSCTVSVR